MAVNKKNTVKPRKATKKDKANLVANEPINKSPFKALYYLTGDGEYARFKDTTSILYLKSLGKAIQHSKEAVDAINIVNDNILKNINAIVQNNALDETDILSITSFIDTFLNYSKQLFSLAKDAISKVEVLSDLERKILKDAEENYRLLAGNKVKFAREDPD